MTGITVVAANLSAALVLWLCLGWLMDFYVASTAEDRFKTALLHGDLATACVNAGIAADAYDMAQDKQAYRKWQGLKTDVCRQ